MRKIAILTVLLGLLVFASAEAQNLTAKQIVQKAYDQAEGKSSKGTMTMEIIRPTWKRSVSFKMWTKGREFSMTYVSAPAKEKGQTFLKRNNDMWSWNPKISRMIKMPPSMLSQGWMGSDYTNDDILKESSIVVDYTHKIVGSVKLQDLDCYKIELTPKPDAAVVWGKIIKYIAKDKFLQLKSVYYDEDDELVKTETASEIKQMGGRMLPTRIEIIPADKPKNKTVVTFNNMQYDVKIEESFFSQQNMKRVK